MGLFERLHNDGVTIIMITHAKEIAEYADRIITIFDGRITSDESNENKRIVKPEDIVDNTAENIKMTEPVEYNTDELDDKTIDEEIAEAVAEDGGDE